VNWTGLDKVVGSTWSKDRLSRTKVGGGGFHQ